MKRISEKRATSSVVMPRESGASSTPRPLKERLLSLEYWIARSSRAMTTLFGCLNP
jgi:uncharacterized protein